MDKEEIRNNIINSNKFDYVHECTLQRLYACCGELDTTGFPIDEKSRHCNYFKGNGTEDGIITICQSEFMRGKCKYAKKLIIIRT